MRLTSVLALAFMFAGAGFAQTEPAQLGNSGASAVRETCPVDFRVERQSGLVAHSASDVKGGPEAESLDLRFDQRRAPGIPSISSVTVVVHGFTRHALTLPVQNQPAETSQTFHLAFGPRDSLRSVFKVQTNDITFTVWAQLTEIRFADGRTWHPSQPSACRVMLSMARLT